MRAKNVEKIRGEYVLTDNICKHIVKETTCYIVEQIRIHISERSDAHKRKTDVNSGHFSLTFVCFGLLCTFVCEILCCCRKRSDGPLRVFLGCAARIARIMVPSHSAHKNMPAIVHIVVVSISTERQRATSVNHPSAQRRRRSSSRRCRRKRRRSSTHSILICPDAECLTFVCAS